MNRVELVVGPTRQKQMKADNNQNTPKFEVVAGLVGLSSLADMQSLGMALSILDTT
jgi:hypothetical protein